MSSKTASAVLRPDCGKQIERAFQVIPFSPEIPWIFPFAAQDAAFLSAWSSKAGYS
jgi:hypothetical protein